MGRLPFVGNLFRQGIVADYSYGDPIGRFATVGFRKRSERRDVKRAPSPEQA
jgi:hypothetical protein